MSLMVGSALYPLFTVLDWVVYREEILTFLMIRAVVMVFLWLVALLVLRATSYQGVILPTAFGLVVPAAGVAMMCHLTEGLQSPYYAGIPLCFVFVAAFLTWPLSLTVVTFSLVLAGYYVPAIATFSAGDSFFLALNSSFLVGTTSLVLLGMRLRGQLAWEVFDNREALAQRNRELAELHDLKDRMFQNVSHELRTPLTLMLAPLQRRLERELPESERRWTEELRSNGLRLLKQIDDLLDLARLDSKGMSVDYQSVDVGALLTRLLEDVHSSARAAKIDIDLLLPPRRVVYRLDPVHVERIVLNLLSNALKFTPAEGRIVASLQEDRHGMVIRVEDNGCGIEPEDQERIFERFRQADGSSTRKVGGSGIGLALVAELAELMGGSVGLESRMGKGSVFTVKFPGERAEPSASAEELERHDYATLHREADLAALAVRPEVESRLVAGKRGPRVLIAEDDDYLRRHLVEVLAPDHRVLAVAGGDEAFREALVFRPQVVVSDVMMPGIDGLELCRRLRERLDLRDTGIVLLTARGRLEERIEGRKAGVDSYLTKPFEVRELRATIEGLLRSRMHLIGEYLVHSPLGSGGQGEVLLAENRMSGERVALKVIRLRGLEDVAARRRLRREHEALTRLEHPNIVRIVAEGEEGGSFFLAMEYVDGATVDEAIRARGRLQAGAAATIGAAAAGALAHVHSEGLLHRDVKCSNLMLLEGAISLGASVRLIDFGTVAAVQRPVSRAAAVVGSLPYLAPELLRAEAEASEASDVYGLGVVLYRMLTGSVPYRGATSEEVLESMDASPLRGSWWEPDVPGDLARATAAALAAADERPSARSLATGLARWADEGAVVELPQRRSSRGGTKTLRSREG